jgi:hypothetical protein
MYKRITHTIVEEHFDHPMAVEMSEGMKKTGKAPLRYYADGEQIASDLPPSYAPGTTANQCGNCLAFDASRNMCKKWMLPVRADYVCAAWTAI